jgi:very-short-patch-repair endonuclease
MHFNFIRFICCVGMVASVLRQRFHTSETHTFQLIWDASAVTDAREESPDMRGKLGSDHQIGALADDQEGVVARRQLLAMGFGERAIDHRIETGYLFPRYRGVYSVGRRKLTRRGHWMAAALACGPDAVLSHLTALALHGVRPTNQSKVDVTVPGGRADRGNLRIHRGVLDPEERTFVDRIPVTSVARTLLDAAAVLNDDQLTRAIEQAERMQLFDLRALERAMARRPRVKGSVRLRRVVAAYRDPAPIRSELERRFLELVRRNGLPEPAVNSVVAGLEVDFCWRDARLVVELDGRAYHSSPRAFEEDRIRDAGLQRAGFRVLRITYRRLWKDPAGVIADINAFVSRAA